jgi:two-component system invasion response regulator UvrY
MKILLLEDHPIFRLGVRQLIERRWPESQCIEASTQAEALAVVKSQELTLAVVDLNLPDTTGIDVVPKLLRAAPGLRILVLSLNAEAAYAQRILQLGAAGYLTKDRAAEDLVVALERIAGGRRYITDSLAELLFDTAGGQREAVPHETLSSQEYRVMLYLAAGKRISNIAESMKLSPKTISTYRSRVLEKLALSSNAELARYCLQHGLDTSV